MSMQDKRARRNRLKTPTLALTRQLNRLNGTTLSTWLTLRGAVQACLQDTTKVCTRCTPSIFPCSQVCAQVRCTQAGNVPAFTLCAPK